MDRGRAPGLYHGNPMSKIPLVTDHHPDEENAMAYVFKSIEDDGNDLTYEEVVDEKLLGVLSGIFEELLDVSLQ